MKHTSTYFVIALCIAMIIPIGQINALIKAKPSRTAYIETRDSSTKQLTKQPVGIRATTYLTDRKLVNWLDKVVPTCFSFTLSNVDSKSLYCARKYFNSTAGSAYINGHVATVAEAMNLKTANFYTAVPYAPVITQPFSLEKKRYYYTVYVQTIRSVVERKSTSPSYKGVWLFVAPNIKARDEGQFMIIGIKA